MKIRCTRTASTSSNSTNEREKVPRTFRDIAIIVSEDVHDDASSFCSSVSGSIDISDFYDQSLLPLPLPPLSTPPPPSAPSSPPLVITTPSPRRQSRCRPQKGPGRTQRERQASYSTTATSNHSCVSESRWDCSSTKDFMPTVSPGIHRKRPATISCPNGPNCRDVPLQTLSLVASRRRSLALSPRASHRSNRYEFGKGQQEDSRSQQSNKNFNKGRDCEEILLSTISPPNNDKYIAEHVQNALAIVKNGNSLSPKGRHTNDNTILK
jgi:hypothetical protein